MTGTKIWDTATGQLVYTLPFESAGYCHGFIRSIGFSPGRETDYCEMVGIACRRKNDNRLQPDGKQIIAELSGSGSPAGERTIIWAADDWRSQ